MKYSYRLHPEADKDLTDAYAWYEAAQPGLGMRFIESFYRTLDSITLGPDMFASKRKGYRETRMGKIFPFAIVFKVYRRKKEVVIFSIFHDKRNPREKYRR